MATKIYFEDYKKDKAIEISGGTVLDIPERSAELYEKIVDAEKAKDGISEYEYLKRMIEALFGAGGFKKIAPEGRKTNLDYLNAVVIQSLELFLEDKILTEQKELEKRLEHIRPIADQIGVLSPFADKIVK